MLEKVGFWLFEKRKKNKTKRFDSFLNCTNCELYKFLVLPLANSHHVPFTPVEFVLILPFLFSIKKEKK